MALSHESERERQAYFLQQHHLDAISMQVATTNHVKISAVCATDNADASFETADVLTDGLAPDAGVRLDADGNCDSSYVLGRLPEKSGADWAWVAAESLGQPAVS